MYFMIIVGYAWGIPRPIYFIRKENERRVHRPREKIPQGQEIDKRLSAEVYLLWNFENRIGANDKQDGNTKLFLYMILMYISFTI